MGKYDYLIGTIWCVPPQSIIAVKYSSNFNSEQLVQVVWVIDNVKDNYVYGRCYSHFEGYTSSYLYGMIGPENELQFNFEGGGKNLLESNIYSTGKIAMNDPNMIVKGYDKKYIIHMQVNMPLTPQIYLMHNAYMIQITKKSKYYHKLPATKSFNNGKYLSVPEFIKNAEESNQ